MRRKCPYDSKKCEVKGHGECPFPNNNLENMCVYYTHPCSKCSLSEPYIQFGSPESGVMVLAGSEYEAPAEWVLNTLKKASYNLNKDIAYYYTPAVKCKTSSKPTMATIRKCNPYIKKEIEIIKPKFVLLVGETAFKSVLWDFDLNTRRKPELGQIVGYHISKEDVIYFPVFGLNDIQDNTNKQYEFIEHLKKFIRIATGDIKITPVRYKELETEEELIYIREEAERTGRVAVDIETHLFTPFLPESEILTLSFTVRENESFCVPLSFRTGEYFKRWNFTPKINTLLAISYISKLLKNKNITKIFHNASFDIMWLEHILGLEVVNYDDTMIMKFLMNQNEQDKKTLKYLTRIYTDMGEYEYNIKQYVGDGEPYSNIPPEVLIRYNNADTDATLRLWNIFKPMLKELKLDDVHYNFMIPKSRGIIDLQKTGISLNINHCIDMKAEYENRLTELYSELKSLPQVANFERCTGMEFAPTSDKHKFAMVYGGEITTDEEIPRRIKNGKKVGAKEYRKVLYNGFNLEPILIPQKSVKTGKKEMRQSFSKKAIQKYLKTIYKEIEYLDPINTFNLESLPGDNDLMRFIKLTSEIGSIQTQLSNHIDTFINMWGRTVDKCVHTSYNITGTATGRLSCIAKGTMISYPDKLRKCVGFKNIENVKLGDKIYTFDDYNNCLVKEVTWSGRTGHEQCLEIQYIYESNGEYIEDSLECTYTHKIRTFDGRWIPAIHLNGIEKPKLLVLGIDKYTGLETAKEATILRIRQGLMKDVYNLEVDGTHRFIANGVCVKNSSSPNLQNLARNGFVKEAFCSRWGNGGVLLEADYKQLELFIMAIVSQDPLFTHAFLNGIDLHLKTAAEIVFRCPEDKVSKQMRTMAKTVNFGMIYGKTAYTLKDDLNVSEEEAQRILDGYFNLYKGVKAYCDRIINQARSQGYVTTVMGRRRYLDYSDPNGADRQAVNTTIQSPASDVCVTAVNLLQNAFKSINNMAVVCGTVHDSIIIDCKREVVNEVAEMTKLIMENTGLPWVTIPLKVDIKYGHNLRNMTEWDNKSTIEV